MILDSRSKPRNRRQGIVAVQTLIAASCAATVQGCPGWLKSAARVILVLSIVKGAAWLVTSWLAFRGMGSL